MRPSTRAASIFLLASSVVLPACEGGKTVPTGPGGSGGQLTVTIGAATTSGRAPLDVGFTSDVHGGNGQYVYAWSFGDGTASSEPNPRAHFTAGGTFPVTLRVTAGSESVTSAPVTVNVDSDVRLLCFVDDPEGSAPHDVRFRALVEGGTGAYGYTWSFGDGASSNAATPVHTYTAPGNYTERLVVNSGGVTASCSDTIRIFGDLAVECRAKLVGGRTVQFNAIPSFCLSSGCNYAWDFGDGTFLSDDHASRPQHEYGPAGLRTVFVTVKTGREKQACRVDVNVP
jgi:PKD repeat protein